MCRTAAGLPTGRLCRGPRTGAQGSARSGLGTGRPPSCSERGALWLREILHVDDFRTFTQGSHWYEQHELDPQWPFPACDQGSVALDHECFFWCRLCFWNAPRVFWNAPGEGWTHCISVGEHVWRCPRSSHECTYEVSTKSSGSFRPARRRPPWLWLLAPSI